jgi:hypothetical protein
VALAPTTGTMSGAAFHLLVTMLMCNWYLVVFMLRVYVMERSLEYVNSMNCIVSLDVLLGGWVGGWWWYASIVVAPLSPTYAQ